MRPSQKLAIETDIARRLAEAQAYLDAQERAASEKAQANHVVVSQPPALQNAPPVDGSPKPLQFSYTVRPSRPRHTGGRGRIWADFFELLSDLMADGTTLKKAAAKLGLTFSARDIKRLYKLKEFKRLRLAKRRLFNSSAFGQPNSQAVLEKLLILENGKCPPRRVKPTRATYINSPPRPEKQGHFPRGFHRNAT
jgi:hypothetical protein